MVNSKSKKSNFIINYKLKHPFLIVNSKSKKSNFIINYKEMSLIHKESQMTFLCNL